MSFLLMRSCLIITMCLVFTHLESAALSFPGAPSAPSAPLGFPGAPTAPSAPSSSTQTPQPSTSVTNQPAKPIKPPLSLQAEATQQVLAAGSSAQQASVMFKKHTDATTSTQALIGNPTTAGAQQVTFRTKTTPPPAFTLMAQQSQTSFTALQQNPVTFKPNGGICSDGQINTLYTTFINSIENTPGFLPIFRKLHIVALHQIYEYLMGIYSALNMTHIDDLGTYVALESLYGLNKKTVIINSLINLIEGQLNQALTALFPAMPQSMASHVGMMCVQSDQATRTDLLVIDIERVVYQTFQTPGVFPNQWTSVLDGLNNPDYGQFLAGLNQSTLNSIKQKITSFLNNSMDLGGTSNYIKGARDNYKLAPQANYWGSSIPSGLAWQKKVNDIAATSSDTSLLPEYISLFQQMNTDEQTTLVDALDILIAHFSSNQALQDCASLIPLFSGSATSQTLTSGQFTLLLDMVRNLAFAGPVNDEITIIKRIYPQLVSGSSQPLTPDEKTTVNGLVAYVSLRIEQDTAQSINNTVALIQQLLANRPLQADEQKLLQKFSGFTALQKGTMQIIASALQQDPTAFNALTQNDLTVISNAFNTLSVSSSDFPDASIRSLFGTIRDAFKNGPVNLDLFSVAQKNAFNQALTYFANYDPGTYTFDQAEQDMYLVFPEKNPDGTYLFDTVTGSLEALENSNTESFANKTNKELLMLLGGFQGSGRVVEARMRQHVKDCSEFSAIFDTQPDLKAELYLNVSFEAYANLIGIYETLNPATPAATSFSFADLSIIKRQALGDIINLLITTDTPGQTITNSAQANSVPLTTKYLEQIQAAYLQNQIVQDMSHLVTHENYQMVKALFTTLQTFNFKLSMLTSEQKQFLVTALQQYQTELTKVGSAAVTKVPSSQTATKGINTPTHPLSDEDEINISGVAPMLHAFVHLTDMQNNFKKVLGNYLNFFASYTATLYDEQTQPNTTATSELSFTKFTQYAQDLAKKIQSATNTSGNPLKLSDMNPPLFFYDQETLETLNLLTFLAKEVEGTLHAPYPTFAVEAALSTSPFSEDPKQNNQIIAGDTIITVPSLLVTFQGTAFSPKFFFKDEFGNSFANNTVFPALTNTSGQSFTQQTVTNQKLPWLSKKTVPVQDVKNNYNAIYTPSFNGSKRVLPKGLEGLYMNIPITITDPTQDGKLLIRLYEQPLLPQPDWLNSAEGVLTMTRVCLGDFTSGLMLGEPVFDPALQLIFRQALATLPNLPARLPQTVLDNSPEALLRLSQEAQLSLTREYLDQATRQTASQQIAAPAA